MACFYTTNKKAFFERIAHLSCLILFMVLISSNVNSQQPFGEGITAKKFFSSTIDDNNVVWFLTDKGIISYDGAKWTPHNNIPNVKGDEAKDLDYGSSENGQGLWIAGSNGATVISSPVNAGSVTKTYTPDNSSIVSNNIFAVSVGKKGTRWFGTDKGISAFQGTNWLENKYEDLYPDDIFEYFPFSTMAASNSGDTLYVGTIGGGVLRFYKDDVDAISGASEYAIWGPINMPSDDIYSVHISADGVQWIGTDKGVARHTGHNTLENWSVFNTDHGLAGNKVNAINSDSTGKLYFGTDNGLSVFDGANWATYRAENGLVSNNILTISVDKNNVVWLGTDNGVSSMKDGKFTSYK
jgi:ligand-binding sensor domain-containing protein